ncbi:Uncharacterised protein [uncultured archaeon]|nr:Uncharacterised protein [uncultured archaeon]
MSLIKKLNKKTTPLLALIPAMIMGCSSTSKVVGSRWEVSSSGGSKIINTEIVREKERAFSINSFLEDGVYKSRVTQKAGEFISSVDTFGNETIYKETQNVNKQDAFNPLFTFLTPLATIALGFAFDGSKGNEATKVLVFGSSGLLIGVGIDGLMWGSSKRAEIVSTGRYKSEITPTKKQTSSVKYNLLEEAIVGEGVRVFLDNSLYLTDNNGEINLSDIFEKNPNYFFRPANESGRGLIERMKQIPLVAGIKPETFEKLMNELINSINTKQLRMSLKTDCKGYFREDIIKDYDGILNANVPELSNQSIYNIVKGFVDREINSSIKTIDFLVKDDLTHYPISGERFTFSSNAPEKREIAHRYFTGETADFAEGCINNYLTGSMTANDCSSEVRLKVFAPSELSVEVIHPDYNFVSGNIVVDKSTGIKNVYMVEKGTKVRVDDSDEGKGRIE